jgi:hypothetical protein
VILRYPASAAIDARNGRAMKEFRLGILFVHGVGTQPPRDTLVRWGDVLLKVIGRAMEEKPGRTTPIVSRAEAGDRSGAKPAEVVVELRCSDREKEKWLLTESWWADSFPTPTYSELVSWSFRAVPWSIAVHIAHAFWETDPQASKGAWGLAAAKAVGWLLLAMALTPMLLIILGLTLVLGLLPIPQLRTLILSMQTTLVGTVGDSLAFVESPLRAALIRGRISEGIERLRGCCERTIVVAHSQGAAATLDAVGGILDPAVTGEAPAARPEVPVPDALVTFGSGVNQLVSLKVLSAGRLSTAIITAPVAAAAATLGIIVLLAIFGVTIQSGGTSFGRLLVAFTCLLLFYGVTALVFWGFHLILYKFRARRLLSAQQELGERLVLASGAMAISAAFLIFVASFFKDSFKDFVVSIVNDDLILPVLYLALWPITLVESLKVILSAATRTELTKPVRHPPGLSKWMDVYASADPIPNGPTRMDVTSAEVASVKVWNRGAFMSDHTSYWENLDGFVLRVARMCAETADSPWQDKLPPATQAVWLDRRAAWRVRLLRQVVLGNWLLWGSLLYLLWKRHGARVPVPFIFPSWFRDWAPTAERFIVLSSVIVVAAWTSAAVLRWAWSVWVRAEQEAVIAHRTPDVSTWLRFIGLGFVISALGALAFALVLALESKASMLLADPKFWLDAFYALVITAGLGLILPILVYWLFPGPQPPCIEGENIGATGPHPRISSQASMPPRSEA